MARIIIADLDVNYELNDRDLDAVVAGANTTNAPSVRVERLLPENVFPAIGSSKVGL